MRTRRMKPSNVVKPNPYGDDGCTPTKKLTGLVAACLLLFGLIIVYYFLTNKQAISKSMERIAGTQSMDNIADKPVLNANVNKVINLDPNGGVLVEDASVAKAPNDGDN